MGRLLHPVMSSRPVPDSPTPPTVVLVEKFLVTVRSNEPTLSVPPTSMKTFSIVVFCTSSG